MNRELVIRSLPMPAEWRVEKRDDDKPIIRGYAAIFNEPTELWAGYKEVIKPGAFSQTLSDKDDVRALWNHNDDLVLGRTASGTLRLKEDEHGLLFEIDPPDTTWAKDHMVTLKRGDVNQSSFGFVVRKDSVEVDNEVQTRNVLNAKLYDVSPVTYPQYPQTEAEVRSFLAERKGLEVEGLKEIPRDEIRRILQSIRLTEIECKR